MKIKRTTQYESLRSLRNSFFLPFSSISFVSFVLLPPFLLLPKPITINNITDLLLQLNAHSHRSLSQLNNITQSCVFSPQSLDPSYSLLFSLDLTAGSHRRCCPCAGHCLLFHQSHLRQTPPRRVSHSDVVLVPARF
ncbi:hypothetical protein RND81_04G050800 [Saponaria officinalis]|uniref:Uncharacterized protein n=1 Tax=Saponaria officinalis TaxID=3572 RepID=A0AAW1LI74_SAPOF